MERARFAVEPHPAEIVQPVSQVRVLLRLEEHQPGAQRVGSPWRHENRLPGFGAELAQELPRGSLFCRRSQPFLGHAGLRSQQETRRARRLYDIPHLGLAEAARLASGGVVVVRVHLHGKPVGGEEVFRQDGKPAMIPGPAQQFSAVLPRSLAQRDSCHGTVQESRRVIRDPHFPNQWPDRRRTFVSFRRTCADRPRGSTGTAATRAFGSGESGALRVGKQRRQVAPSPDFWFVDGGE